MKLFVGLDVSSVDIKVCFLNGEGGTLNSFTVENDLPGATVLRGKTLHTAQGKPVSELCIGLKSTKSVYYSSIHVSTQMNSFKRLMVKFL